MPPRATPDSLLDLIIAKAPGLRAAGVQGVQIDGCAFTLTPWESPAGPVAAEPEPEYLDPLYDPATYAAQAVPGVVVPHDDPSE